jgi:NhaA family Na+:H+ antiporter
LAAAIVGLAAMRALRRLRVWYLPVYIVLGIGVWLCTFESGVHATIAGVAIGLITPARPLLSEPEAERIADRLSSDTSVTAEEVRQISFELRESVSLAERIEDLLHPWSSYVIVPVFALANAGVALSPGVTWSGWGDGRDRLHRRSSSAAWPTTRRPTPPTRR